MEAWRPVSGYETLYEVSDAGRVRSNDRVVPCGRLTASGTIKRRGRVLRPIRDKPTRQLYVNLCGHLQPEKTLIAFLVLAAFDRPPEPGEFVKYIDGDRGNLAVSNLRWWRGADYEVEVPDEVVGAILAGYRGRPGELTELSIKYGVPYRTLRARLRETP